MSKLSANGRKGRAKSPWGKGPMVKETRNWIRFNRFNQAKKESDERNNGRADSEAGSAE